MAYIGAGISRFNTADELTVTGTSEFGGNVSFGDNNITNVGSLQIDSIAGDADTNTNITFAGSDVITMTTAGSERMRIDASGNVGINNTSPQAPIHIIDGNGSVSGASYRTATPLVLENNSNTELQFFSNSSNDAQIRFGDGDSNFAGAIEYKHGSDAMLFYTAVTERMRIDSSGNVLVGKTAEGVGNIGFQARPDGFFSGTRDGGTVAYLQRKTSDGEILRFQNATTTVGSIGSVTAGLEINSTSALVLESNKASTERKIEFGNDYFGPDSGDDNAIDLGRSGARFNDVFLGGGAYIGGTGSANYLDDYEEGNSTVTVTPQTSGSITLYGSTNQLSYTKIGRSVHVQCELQVEAVSSPVGGYLNIIGLPFTIASLIDLGERFGGGLLFHPGGGSASVKPFFGFSGTQFLVYVDASTVTVNTSIGFTFSYLTS